jgi:hypothetical protein
MLSTSVELMGRAADLYHHADSGNNCDETNCPGAAICPHAESLDIMALRAVVSAVEFHMVHVFTELLNDLR